MFLRNVWYVAAWAKEVDDTLFSRRLLGQPVLIYRGTDGQAIAIGNRCPHRFAPLSRGKKLGDNIECGYHGLQFNPAGACVLNPQGTGHIPPGARVPSYPLVERDELLWIWMGDADQADPSTIPDLPFMRRPGANTDGEYLLVQADYRFVTDNLMDLSHAATLHGETLGHITPGILDAVIRIVQDEDRVTATLEMPGVEVPGVDGVVDQWLETRWRPAAIMELEVGQAPAGGVRTADNVMSTIHAVTPETEQTSHYFFCNSARARGVYKRDPFLDEDGPMLAACQDMLGSQNFWDAKPAVLPNDAGAVRVRRMIDKLLRIEATAEHQETRLDAVG